jgi:hypothetical protein
MKRSGLQAAFIACAALALTVPAAAGGGIPTGLLKNRTAGVAAVRTPGLTRAERNALSIRRITARGGSWGVAVRVRLKGDFQSAIGRGHLRRGLLALVLKPKPHNGKAAVLVTTGRLGHSRTLRRTSSKQVGVIRDGKQVEFYILGGGLRNVSRIQVKAFARKPRVGRRARRAQTQGGLTAREIEAIKGLDADGEGSIPPPASRPPCDSMRAEAKSIADRFTAVYEELKTATGDAQNKLTETTQSLDRALLELRPVMGHDRCFKLSLRLAYHHHGTSTSLCGDLDYDAPVGVHGRPQLFIRRDDGVFEPATYESSSEGGNSLTHGRITWTIAKYGTYKVVVHDPDLAEAVEEVITVVPPPPEQTSEDCP